MAATLFFGIAFDSTQYHEWIDGWDEKLADTDEGEELLENLEDEAYELWNSYLFDKELVPFHTITGHYSNEDTRQNYLAIKESHVSCRDIEFLGKMTPDPEEWKTYIDQAVAHIEAALEKKIGRKIVIPTRGKIQWHLANSYKD